MICTSDLLVNFVGKSYLLKDKQADNIEVELLSNNFPQGKQQSDYLNRLWERLIFWPLSFQQNQNSHISNILEEETNLLASESIRAVLSDKLELPLNSKNLSEVIKDSFKIFHEDFPYDFILVYKGERLGMMMLDKCLNSNGDEKLMYRFQPHITSFRGLF